MQDSSDGPSDLSVGARFDSKDGAIVQLKSYAVKRRFEFHVVYSDKKRYRIRCRVEGCSWFVHASPVAKGSSSFAIKTIGPDHVCGTLPTLGNTAAGASWVQSVIREKVRDTPAYCSNEIIADIRREFGVEVDYKTAWRALTSSKSLATEAWDESFQLLPTYLHNLKLSNPDTRTQLLVDDNKRFLSLFLSFNSCCSAFQSCRPVVGLDGTFLKGKYLGTLLVATAIDAEGSIFPLAVGVARNECEETWRCFLKQLFSCVTPPASRSEPVITFLTDRQKGLINAVADVFPVSHHGFCLRHLEANVRTAFKPKKEVIDLIWKAAREPTASKFNVVIDQIKAIDSAVAAYLSESAAHWATALFKGERYGQLTSNIAESLNAWLLEARELPVVSMCEKIRTQCMQLFTTRKAVGFKISTDLVTSVHKKVEDCKERARTYRMIRASTEEFEVYTTKHQRAVHLGVRTCSCNRWQQLGYPCSHAAAALMSTGISIVDATSKHLLASAYRATYAVNLHPHPGRDDWVQAEDLPSVAPPPTKRPPGRPKKRRFRTEDMFKQVRALKCGRCGGSQHNKRTCKEPI